MNSFVRTKEFAEYVAHSDSYYVLVTRWNLKNLPYSVEEIYKLTEQGKIVLCGCQSHSSI